MKQVFHTALRSQSGLPCARSRISMRSPVARWGSVLLLVVVVVGMLTLAAYNYAQNMTTELEAATMYLMTVQAKASADSGIEFAATIMGDRSDLANQNLIHNPMLFAGHVVSASPHPRANSRFTIIAPVEHDTMMNAIRYGLMDESAKLNLNFLPNMGLSNDTLDAWLMLIPNMTQDIADSILDWMDSDDTANPYGAESETYMAMSPPYKAKNGPFENIDELLLVKGMTPTLLYGEDANRNGLLDPNENDGMLSPPMDNADGVLDHGFVAYFTVLGRESNRRKDGKLKINLNNGYLTDLYDALMEEFDDKTVAQFIIGFRLKGPSATSAASTTNPVPSSTSGSTTSTSTSTTSSTTSSSTSSPTSVAPVSRTDQEAASSVAAWLASFGGVAPAAGSVTRDGIDLSGGATENIDSIWQLLGPDVTVNVTIEGARQTLNSPWPDMSSISTTYPDLIDKLTITSDESLEGRINVNQARREILMGIPTMTDQIADAIIAAQQLDANGQPSLDKIREHATTAWLVTENLVDLSGMISIDPYITTRGDVYKAQVLGFFDGGGPVCRIEVMLDGTLVPPRVISQRDLGDLGRGYSRMQLLPFGPVLAR